MKSKVKGIVLQALFYIFLAVAFDTILFVWFMGLLGMI